jgi:hypothetical protein
MITLMIAAAASVAEPAVPAKIAAKPSAQHEQIDRSGDHKDGCCKCCKDMGGKHEDHASDHAAHPAR